MQSFSHLPLQAVLLSLLVLWFIVALGSSWWFMQAAPRRTTKSPHLVHRSRPPPAPDPLSLHILTPGALLFHSLQMSEHLKMKAEDGGFSPGSGSGDPWSSNAIAHLLHNAGRLVLDQGAINDASFSRINPNVSQPHANLPDDALSACICKSIMAVFGLTSPPSHPVHTVRPDQPVAS